MQIYIDRDTLIDLKKHNYAYLGISAIDINKFIRETKKLPNNLQGAMIIKIEKNVILIDDCYNANPSSVSLAIDRFNELFSSGKKIFIFADMLELGSCSQKEHIKIAKKLDNTNITDLLLKKYLVGLFVSLTIKH